MFKVIATLMIFSISLFAQYPRGVVKEGLKVQSKVLSKDVRYTVYLPADYNTSSRYYPVVYLLHGYTDNDMGWLQFGEINRFADKAIADGTIPPMIIVTPDAGVSWYINNYDGSVKYEDFFIKEFIPFIESQYRIRKAKRYRGVAGLSMGGYGTLIYAMKYPELFSAAAPLSAAVYTDEQVVNFSQERWDKVEGVLFGKGLKGKARLTEHFKDNSPLHMLDNLDVNKIKTVRYYFDCGDDDNLSLGNCEMHIKMKALGIPHEFRMRDGKHNWIYWRSGIVDALEFIGQRFH